MLFYPMSFPFFLKEEGELLLLNEKEILRLLPIREYIYSRIGRRSQKKDLIHIRGVLGYYRFDAAEAVVSWINAGMPAFIPVETRHEFGTYRFILNPAEPLGWRSSSSIFPVSDWEDWGDYLELFGLFLKKTNQEEINRLKELRKIKGDIF